MNTYSIVAATLLLLLSSLHPTSSDIVDSEDEIQEIDHERSIISSSSGYYFDHASSVVRRSLDPRSVDDINWWSDYARPFDGGLAYDIQGTMVAFGSDDVPADEELRRELIKANGIEDALLLKLGSKSSPLRDGWGGWFDAKSDFLRKDKMFKSRLEVLNTMSNPLLQDPDGFGVTGFTRGDKIVKKGLFQEIKKAPILIKKSFGFSDVRSDEAIDYQAKERSSMNRESLDGGIKGERLGVEKNLEARKYEFRTLGYNEIGLGDHAMKGVYDRSLRKNAEDYDSSLGKDGEGEAHKAATHNEIESSGSMFSGGRRWGYFPVLHPNLSFSNFMDSFFRKSKCSIRVFMVWNSPPWMYTVRHQRGLESVLFHHPDACIVVFSETIELDFFKEFLKDGFKIAVTMPNLEELLKDTPTSIFTSVWHEWRTTKFYSTHYSELIRLAALYKYGGVYLDCDIVVLKPISGFRNSVGMEELTPGSPLNGAVMAFNKHSLFIRQCMLEFFSSYDDTLLRWNGADLLTRVAGNFSLKADNLKKKQMLQVQLASNFFPISSHDIQRYFIAPVTDDEKAHQHALLRKILTESNTFHFWNSLTSGLVPEPYSMVAKIMNKFCIHCLDML
ncbi:uncharacterized protein At4g19900-like isoform X2 [Chenopodium quinoa]|uniref:uncharacterized protein At4g19900-like isoform X2 n=1 Tax=Chenopodium quinoa TaxID=63459 RepID=UPI000B777AEE|nr:uncharacterized protein At4g19900-like isoform X2 [Chenopodium quinoa]